MDIEGRLTRVEDAILGRDGLLAQVAAIRAILTRLEANENEYRGRYVTSVTRSECDKRHAEYSAWSRAIVPAIIGAALALVVSLLTRCG